MQEEVVVGAVAAAVVVDGDDAEAVDGKERRMPRKVMVVADPSHESAAALDYALTHALLDQDELILLHVEPAYSLLGTLSAFLKRSPSHTTDVDDDFLDAMKAACERTQKKVRVQVERVEMEGKDKASAILLQTKAFSIDLLIIGQRRHLTSAMLGCRLSGSRSHKGIDTAEYCIENSKCLCVGVQKKGANAGYLLNTKKHKNFWLLA